MSDQTYQWQFPLPRTHTGMLQGNGLLGAMIWGEGSVLRVTIGRADYWDRRGGSEWTAEMSYANILKHLAAGDEAALGEIFPRDDRRPSVLPIGRFELEFAGATLETAALDLATGACRVTLHKGRKTFVVRLAMDMDEPVLAVRLGEGLKLKALRRVTSWQYVGEHLRSIGFSPPRQLDRDGLLGWTQAVPEDPSLCVAARRNGRDVLIAATLGDDVRAARAAATAVLSGAAYKPVADASARWWGRYWRRIGRATVPNPRLQFLYDYGMYKFAGLTACTSKRAVPATLQGPWIEEYQMPPWSSDYHFNINVQMCYWPAYHGNAVEHLRPLFEMVHGWTDILRHNARRFADVDDGRLLPHAVSDTCKFMCGYWGHSVDHGSTAWVAQMMFRYYRYTLDEAFLRDVAYPFMVGAMAVYEAMLEKRDGRYHLELGVSPEYFTKDRRGLGPNASFQLACIHRLAEDLLAASAVLGRKPKRIWRDYLKHIPRACVEAGDDGRERIVLWEGDDLAESHRHHSHLGGIVPFDLFDPPRESNRWRAILAASLDRWCYLGMGLWSGWCVPWAAMIYTRFGCGETAELLLEMWQRVFTNQGHGTLHDADIPGLTLMGQSMTRQVSPTPAGGGRPEIMQMDAGMGATAAIQEMLLHTRRGVHYVMAAVPRGWRDASFRNFLTEGGMRIGATRKAGRLAKITLASPHGGVFELANPWPGKVRVAARGRAVRIAGGEVLAIRTRPGDRITLTPAAG